MPLILGTNSIKDTGYEVANSVRLDTDTTFTRTVGASPTDADVGTVSFWYKKASTPNSSNYGRFLNIGSTDLSLYTLSDYIQWYIAAGTAGYGNTSGRVYRDQSAWYHIVYAFDSRQSTAADRLKIYTNGEFQDSTVQPVGMNVTSDTSIFDGGKVFCIGATSATSLAQNLDGYLAEYVYVDGQQLDATSFGEFDSDSPNIWKPIDVSGLTFGNNGFYLDFEDSSDLGKDVSGNGNHFTANNLVATDQSTDTCTNNFATINGLNFGSGTLSEGNLKWTASAASGNLAFGTIAIDMSNSDKFYWETKIDSIGSGIVIGLSPLDLRWNDTGRSGFYGYYSDGNKYVGTSASSYGASFTTNDIIGILAGNGTLTFYKNGSSQGDAFTGLTGYYLPSFAEVGMTASFNFGSPPYSVSSGNSDPEGYGNFEYSTNSGYALNTKNLAEYG